MATYSVKLVNHTNASPRLQQAILSGLQDLFNQVFDTTSDNATVNWGSGSPSDSIVIHLVDDIASSYIEQKMPGRTIRGDAGGHTRTSGNVTGSEIYLHMVIGNRRTMSRDDGYAKLAFHEALHNQFPAWSNAQMHGPAGGNGLALSPPQLPITQENKNLMRRGIAIKNAQLL
jgi:hypothetical protein